MAVHADRNGVVAQARFPKNRGMQRRPKGNLRRQLPPQYIATQTPTPPPAPLVVPAPTVAAAAPSVAIPPTEQAIIDLTNQQRMLNGLAPLAASGKLVQAAQIHAGNMAQLNQMSHVLTGVAQPDLVSRAQAVGYCYAKLGENIAFRYAGAPEVVTGWMNSAGHKANILDPGFTEIGVAIAANSKGELYTARSSARPPEQAEGLTSGRCHARSPIRTDAGNDAGRSSARDHRASGPGPPRAPRAIMASLGGPGRSVPVVRRRDETSRRPYRDARRSPIAIASRRP